VVLTSSFCADKSDLKWLRDAESSCFMLCPPRLDLHNWFVVRREIFLKSLGCLKFEVDVLVCMCEMPQTTANQKRLWSTTYFVNGLNGEIYKMRKTCGTCENLNSLTVRKRTPLTHPKYVYDTVVSEWRRWNLDRTKINTSDDDE
jgi:hypothetical protein